MLNEKQDMGRMSSHEHYGDEHKLLVLGELTARVIHELRNPLTVLSLCLSSIERDVASQPDIQEALASALISVERMTNIVNSTLDFVRNENMEFEKLDLRELVKETLPLLNSSMNKKRITISTSFDSDPFPLILGIPSQLQQVIVNIVDNGIDAIAGDGSITIVISASHSKSDQPNVRLEISDTGAGVSQQDLPKIFSPFFTRKKNGTGLGLAITKSILDRHNANEHVRSESGAGTTFSIEFPAMPV